MTDMTLGASGLCLGTRTRVGGTATLASLNVYFGRNPWLHGQQDKVIKITIGGEECMDYIRLPQLSRDLLRTSLRTNRTSMGGEGGKFSIVTFCKEECFNSHLKIVKVCNFQELLDEVGEEECLVLGEHR